MFLTAEMWVDMRHRKSFKSLVLAQPGLQYKGQILLNQRCYAATAATTSAACRRKAIEKLHGLRGHEHTTAAMNLIRGEFREHANVST